MEWLLEQESLREIESWKRNGLLPTPEQCAAMEREADDASAGPRSLSVAGNVAEIAINGVLTESPRFFFSRNSTTFSDIRAALVSADSDPRIKNIVLDINSPGGSVDGMFETIAAIERVKKPIKVRATKALSAAFALAAAGGKIEAAGKAAQFGSIGIAATFLIFDEEVTVTNSDSPNKRPDVTTPEGKAVVIRELDAINDLFTEAIAAGRTRAGAAVTAREVRSSFGRGSTLLAQAAKRDGLIDKISVPELRAVPALDDMDEFGKADDQVEASAISNPADGGQETAMDLSELKAKHRDIYEAIMKEGVAKGAKQERDRVEGHLVYGKKAGGNAMEIALKAIEGGEEMTEKLRAEYMTAGMNHAAATARQGESDNAAGTTDGAAAAAAGDDGDGIDLTHEVVKLMDAKDQTDIRP